MTSSVQDQLDAIDPLPSLLTLLKTLRNNPENNTLLTRETSNIKAMLERGRLLSSSITQGDLSVSQQAEIIAVLEGRVHMKRCVEMHDNDLTIGKF